MDIQAKALEYWNIGHDLALNWITSPAAWSQFAVLVLAYLLAVLINRKLGKTLRALLTPSDETRPIFASAMNMALLFLPLLLPLLAYGFTAIGEQATRAAFGSGDVIAFGKRIFIFLAVKRLINSVIYSPFLKLLGKYIFIPLAAIYALGLLPTLMSFLGDTNVAIGNINFSLLAILRGVIAGSILFWLGRWSNDQSAQYIRAQDDMRVPTRELATKAVELSIFGACFLLLMSIMGINLSALAVFGGAIGVGLGFGLQKIASNFISGIILLLEGQATVGDFVELDGGESGTIVKMLSRATILETYDGKWIVVPNEDFITTRITNWSDAGSGNRYEADFSVSYDTDINKVPAIVEAAVATHPDVLDSPEKPDCELRGFGDSGIDFCVEFWVEGIDDGKNKYTSDVLFLIWNALKDNGIEIPYPHRVVEIKGSLPKT
ncbi:mechanosensitive ion channel protein MscS [Amylibacter kogurei]|uniref:Mechanosensitive ion channel protein MscS n=1 Tax=Paramylibacter kogurei TaxID=1889778 RepID=A0A2G5K254_9RHOB|nr:mechanosensitive ion channel domain-containing protein [Amylibacter kogurei]PIB23093.1 mechanosensitive ion channel protein MscS [Amylibacter kogurei]